MRIKEGDTVLCKQEKKNSVTPGPIRPGSGGCHIGIKEDKTKQLENSLFLGLNRKYCLINTSYLPGLFDIFYYFIFD